MNALDLRLPSLLRGAGGALFVVFLLGAALNGTENPVALVLMLVSGIALGLVVYAAGLVVEKVTEIAEGKARAHADIRSQTAAMLELVEALREATQEQS